MPPQFERLDIEGLILITPQVFPDERGFFLERFRQEWFNNEGIDIKFIQDNQSRSPRGVLRGLHFQAPPHAQDKLVWVVSGEVYDVAVDVRKGSPTYGQWRGVALSADNKQMFFIPKGFAHGFQVISETADFMYKVSDYYAPETDGGIRWDDPNLAIPWPVVNPTVSGKDQQNPFLKDLKSPF